MECWFVFVSHVDGWYLVVWCGVCARRKEPIATSWNYRDVAFVLIIKWRDFVLPEAKIQEDSNSWDKWGNE
jgi:hypothetical protein